MEDKGDTITFLEILEHWDALEADLHHYFQIDMGSDIVRQRDWRWFAVRVKWLLKQDSATARAVRPPEEPSDTTGYGNA
ncbi:hypothetical protein [Corynebacterium coyleae]|uniref:hypothetical protein n=1 Tax=Corynebacterium coyleae TaxID=53374 RepID=UPI00254D3479|nr:hypothetical protein [Corynebacterium coyleae]MDK8241729.1 hypothetical protein [Corynebacterium coyleae]